MRSYRFCKPKISDRFSATPGAAPKCTTNKQFRVSKNLYSVGLVHRSQLNGDKQLARAIRQKRRVHKDYIDKEREDNKHRWTDKMTMKQELNTQGKELDLKQEESLWKKTKQRLNLKHRMSHDNKLQKCQPY